jgi:O-antigen ligase
VELARLIWPRVALVGALLLVFTIVFRPEEAFPPLQVLRLPISTAAIALAGIAYEAMSSRRRVPVTPQLPFVAAFVLWAIVATSLNIGPRAAVEATWGTLGASAIFMAVVALAMRSYARLRALAVLVVALFAVVCAVCIHQSMQPAQCIGMDRSVQQAADASEGTPDGRPCESAYLCDPQGTSPLDYECERLGLFGTTTEGRRVRWRGTLGDPNELALFVGTSIPLIFALASTSRRKRLASLTATALLAMGMVTIVLSESRGGQLVALTVLGLYFVRRHGFKGCVIGALLALPIVVFGGRTGSEADASAKERAELLYDGVDFARRHPFAGLGIGQFEEHTANHLTAHNSYLLAAAELGLLGSFLWALLVYVSIKIPVRVASRPPPGLDRRMVSFATALAVSYAGMLVGIFFLSFCYKQWLFLFFGLSGALYATVKRAHPQFEVRIGWKEAAYVVVGDIIMLVAIFVYSRLQA